MTNRDQNVKEDVLVSNIRPYYKKIWLAKCDGGCSDDVLVFRANTSLVLPKYLYYLLSQDVFFAYMMAGAKGAKSKGKGKGKASGKGKGSEIKGGGKGKPHAKGSGGKGQKGGKGKGGK